LPFPGFPGYPGYPSVPPLCQPCDDGNGNCSADSCNCPRTPWLDCASTFGGMFRSELLQDNLPAGTTGRTLVMDSPLPLQNVGFSGDTLIVQCSGTYELTFFGNFRFSANSHLTFYVKANGHKLDDTVIEKDTVSNTIDSFERTVIVRLCANTSLRGIVDNAAAADGGASGTLTIPANGVHLEIIRIGAYQR
jgi:hypothetical protein